MNSKELIPDRVIAIKLPSPLATALRQAAVLEQNPDSVVARRLIATGLKRELHLKSQTPERDAG